MIERTLKYDELGLTTDELYQAIGQKTATPPDAEMQREVESLLQEVKGLLRARFAFITTGMHTWAKFHPGRIIEAQMKGSEALCWFVATAGQEFEELQYRLMQEGDMVRVYIANEIGSLLAEKTADRMEEVLEEQLTPKGLRHTNRFSPGYCGWHVKEQRQLFDLFAQGEKEKGPVEGPCNIQLTDSCLMLPIKSVSGVIGIGHDVRKLEYSCGICEMEKCYKKRRK